MEIVQSAIICLTFFAGLAVDGTNSVLPKPITELVPELRTIPILLSPQIETLGTETLGDPSLFGTTIGASSEGT